MIIIVINVDVDSQFQAFLEDSEAFKISLEAVAEASNSSLCLECLAGHGH